MASNFVHAPGAVWRRVGGKCLVQIDGHEHLLDGGAAATWIALAPNVGDRDAVWDELLRSSPSRGAVDEVIEVLRSAGLILSP